MIDSIKKIADVYEEPEWLFSLRKEFYSKFLKNPYPESRYTRFKSINFDDFKIFLHSKKKAIPNVIISDKASNYEIKTFHQILKEDGELIKEFMEKLKEEENKFQLFLASLWQEGIYINVKEKTSNPLHILIKQNHPRELILTPIIINSESQEGNIILELISSSENQEKALHISFILVNIRKHSNLEISFLENWSSQIFSINKEIINIEDNAKLNNNSYWLGGKLAHIKREINMIGRNSEIMDLQILFGNGKQHYDLEIKLNHKAEWTKGEVMSRGVLKDEARSVFYGLAKIEKGAQNADSFLSDHILVLSEKARSDSIPALEIEADQVKASHSASIGQIDEDQLFYLACRGLSEEEAKKIIIEGFLEPAISRITIGKIKKRIIHSINKGFNKSSALYKEY